MRFYDLDCPTIGYPTELFTANSQRNSFPDKAVLRSGKKMAYRRQAGRHKGSIFACADRGIKGVSRQRLFDRVNLFKPNRQFHFISEESIRLR
jgi:hypothetical protein